MIGTSVEQIVERCEAEFDRLKRSGRVSSGRVERAENILVTHLSCPKANIIRPRIRGGELVAYLVKGSGASGAVYRIDPESWQCSCPDAHRRGKGCKHAILVWALWRAYRPAPAPTHDGRRRRCAAEPKIMRHELLLKDSGGEDLEHVGAIALRVLEGAADEAVSGSYEERECPRCFEGRLYDGQRGEWVACERCEGSRRILVFVYPKKRRLPECAGCGERFEGRDLYEVQESLTYFEGDLLCSKCAAGSDADVL